MEVLLYDEVAITAIIDSESIEEIKDKVIDLSLEVMTLTNHYLANVHNSEIYEEIVKLCRSKNNYAYALKVLTDEARKVQ